MIICGLKYKKIGRWMLVSISPIFLYFIARKRFNIYVEPADNQANIQLVIFIRVVKSEANFL
jgi:hypothetical protein